MHVDAPHVRPDGDETKLTTESVEPEALVAPGSREASAAPRTLAFLAVFALWGLIWWTPIAWLVGGVVPGGWRMVAVVAVVAILPVGVLIRAFQRKTPPPVFARIWLLRPFWYVQLLLPWAGLGAILGMLVGVPFGHALMFGRWGLAAVTALLVVGAAFGYWGAHRLVLRRLDIVHPHLPPALDGLRIAQLSDLHFGAHTSASQIQRIRTAVRLARPDLIVLTGDQVDDHGPDVHAVVSALVGLDATHGVIAVAGNHDVYVDWPTVRRGMQDAGYKVLVNEALALGHNGGTFWVAGTGDPAAAHIGPAGIGLAPDIEAALRDVPADAFTIALAHNPALWPELRAHGAHLTLSGHTHHGQVSIPRLNWSLASVFFRYAMGHYTEGDSVLYINPGTHYWGIPLRLGAWPEVTQITLQSGNGGPPAVVRDEVTRVPRTKRALA